MSRLASLNINFDSIGWSIGADVIRFRDPTYYEIVERFFEFSKAYGFRYTIFVIGRDLENPDVRARVRDWAAAGHEIGNHSYSHYPNLGSLPRPAIEDEVRRAHDLIASACGREPRGFIAPAWSTSPALIDVLLENRYLYDTSIFPSPLMWAIVAKLWLNFRGDERRKRLVERRDWWANLLANRRAHRVLKSLLHARKSGLLVIPLPTTPFARIPCWHTAAFVFPRPVFDYALRTCLRDEYFYYLVHPADLMERVDLGAATALKNIERMDVPLTAKRRLFDLSLRSIRDRSENIVTLEQMANDMVRRERA